MTTWIDSLKSKWVNFGAKLTSWWDSLKSKWVNFGATLTAWWDSIKNNAYGVKGWLNFGANLTTWWDSLKNKWIDFTASITSWFKEAGGVLAGSAWHSIPQYAGGTANAHGSMFVAGEAGPEIVGHINGRTEILNRSQLASTMNAAVVSGMAIGSQTLVTRLTPHLAMIGASVSRSEQHLSVMAAQAQAQQGGGTVQLAELLRQILTAVQSMDPDVYMDGEKVTDRVTQILNRNTQATGRCAVIV